MVWPLEKHFSFTTDYPMKECRKALTSLESGRFGMKLLELDDKPDEIYCKLARRDEEKGRYLAYSEAQIKLTERHGIVEVSGQAKTFVLQVMFALYFIGVTLTLAYVFRPVLIVSLFLLLGTCFSTYWLRLVFVNRERFIQEIYDLLGMDNSA
jgi:hypothetical protein